MEKMVEDMSEAYELEQKSQSEVLQKQIAKTKDRLESMDRLIARLYEDLLVERITEATFDSMMKKTQTERDERAKELADLEHKKDRNEEEPVDAKRWVDLIKEYAEVDELNADMLNRLIKRIVVHEDITPSGERNISLEIHYNFKPMEDSIVHTISASAGDGSSSLAS